ncbi:phBC6A51 family helix-turn-helix protein [Paenibacillus aestuarii]|uniref:PhBC6A51 family helix-turn-helix protein n=1 Tax=Paenibacillus aestuarii TaxID=516965 RepID=A0ABW0K435_9BACL|nr:phBC6A51 family helix-turn-helix protein [Paenibacillus aestuarii]
MSKFHELKPEKQKAILLLTQSIIDPEAERLTYGKISEECGVDVATLFRWRTQDPDFKAARKELVDSYADEIVGDAFTALRYQLRTKRNVKAAEIVLRSRGMLVDRREGGPDTIVNVGVADQDNDALTNELAELRLRIGLNDM